MSMRFQLNVFKHLLLTDLKIYRQIIKNKVIDLLIWVTTIAFVNAYLMPAFGLPQSYTNFMLAGLCASAGLFEVWPSIVAFINDIEGDRIIEYYITLPIPAWMIFLKSIVSFVISAGTLILIVIPAGKLLLWNIFDLSSFSFIKFSAIFLAMSAFYGAFALMVGSFVKNMSTIGSVWMRFIYPIWFLGGFQFSWTVLFKTSPKLAYLNLINPMTYIMEAIRGAILGQEGYLPFWPCTSMVILFAFACAWYGIVRLKKRLDFV